MESDGICSGRLLWKTKWLDAPFLACTFVTGLGTLAGVYDKAGMSNSAGGHDGQGRCGPACWNRETGSGSAGPQFLWLGMQGSQQNRASRSVVPGSWEWSGQLRPKSSAGVTGLCVGTCAHWGQGRLFSYGPSGCYRFLDQKKCGAPVCNSCEVKRSGWGGRQLPDH